MLLILICVQFLCGHSKFCAPCRAGRYMQCYFSSAIHFYSIFIQFAVNHFYFYSVLVLFIHFSSYLVLVQVLVQLQI